MVKIYELGCLFLSALITGIFSGIYICGGISIISRLDSLIGVFCGLITTIAIINELRK